MAVKELWKQMRDYRKECILGPGFKLLEALFELIVPLIIARLVDEGIRGENAGIVRGSAGLLVLLAVLGLLASVTAQYFAARAAIGYSAKLRRRLFAHIQSLSFADQDRLGAATLITRMTGDVNQVQTGINLGLRLLLRSPFVVFGAMVMAFTIDTAGALLFVGVIAVLFVIVFGIILITMPRHQKVRSGLDDLTAATRENLSGVRVIRAFVQEDAQTARFGRLNDWLTRAQLRVGRWSAAMNPLTFLVLNLAIVLLIRTGAARVEAGSLSQGQLIALYNYMGQILVELIKLANLIVTLTKSAACSQRISGILAVSSSMQDGTEDLPAGGPLTLAFEDVSIRYSPGADDSLEHISFSASSGETVGIIGGTGSGKSTLVQLIPRFYDATGGTVRLNGRDVRDYRLASLRAAVGYVPQHAVLFRGTIRSNLLWGNPNAAEEDLVQAVTAAQALDILQKKEKGLDEEVEQGGRNFSGGQRQRLTIARALVRRPAILILDDSASALDYATDAALRRSLRALPEKPLTLIVSQRTSSVRFADRILVLDDGVCVGQGTHEELLASCPVYREIHEAQQETRDDPKGGAPV